MARSLHKRYKRKYRRNPSGDSAPRANPPLAQDIFGWIGPGFAGFAATRLLTRIAATQIAKHRPTLGKHAGAAASVGAFLAAWFLANRWKALAQYQMPLIVGSGLAAAQSLLQLYVPRIGWVVSDATPQIAAQQARRIRGPRPEELQPVDDDPDEYVYNDYYDAGRQDQAQTRADASAPARASSSTEDDDLSDLDLDEVGGQGVSMGIFGGN